MLVHNYYQLPGGEDRVVQLEANMLKEHGHQVFYYLRKNCEINEFSFINKIGLAFDTIFSMRTYKEVKQMIKDKKIDIVHVHNTFPLISYAVYYAANKCGVPVVQTLHNFRFLCANGLFYRDNKICEL